MFPGAIFKKFRTHDEASVSRLNVFLRSLLISTKIWASLRPQTPSPRETIRINCKDDLKKSDDGKCTNGSAELSSQNDRRSSSKASSSHPLCLLYKKNFKRDRSANASDTDLLGRKAKVGKHDHCDDGNEHNGFTAMDDYISVLPLNDEASESSSIQVDGDTATAELPAAGGEPELSPQQSEILAKIMNGENFFFTGSAGTGKSVLLRAIIKAFKEKEEQREQREAARSFRGWQGYREANKVEKEEVVKWSLAVTASTGMAGV